MWKHAKILASLLCIFTATVSGTNTPARAAERVVVRFGLFSESITLAELQQSADTGTLPSSLQRLSVEQRQFLIGVLRTRIPLNVVTVSRLLNTQIGTTILTDLATAIVRKDQAGAIALRAGLILGSNAPQGLSILSFIAAYPSQSLEINLPQAFQVAGNLNTAFWRTQQFMLGISSQLSQTKPNISLPFDPSQPGTAQVQVMKLNWYDEKRDRHIPVDIYWSTTASQEKPLIVYSHGFASVRTDLRYLAEHLASHGYIFVALEHPGSNQTNTDLAIQGKVRLLRPEEFLDRPKDVSFVLDQLEKLNQTAGNPLQGKLAINNTMILGYSFGGGTALSLAGGELELEELKKRCQNQLVVFSLGETIQCAAQGLPKNRYQLRDKRIKLAMALSPTTSLMFGKNGLSQVQVPTVIVAGSADKTTPALTEQIVAFSKIPSPKWLVGIIGGTHLSVKDPSTTLDQVGQPNTPFSGGEIVGEQAADVRKFLQAIALATAAQLTPEAQKYAIFLSPDYGQAASTKGFPFRIVTEIPPEAIPVVQK